MFPQTLVLVHRVFRLLISVLLAGVLACAAAVAAPAPAPAPITLLTIDGPIGPASADYVVRGIARAAREGSQLVILQIDTPGGLDLSMRIVIKAILNSPVPVASYVAPGGARAASAGTYIVYASHIAAMAPGTNLGAATPVQIGITGPPKGERGKPSDSKDGGSAGQADAASPSAMERKAINDAAAYIRGLAQLRGRNAEWGERAVREGISLSAEEALKAHVIDFVAPDVAALAARVDGSRLKVAGAGVNAEATTEVQLHTAGAPRVNLLPDSRSRLLNVITNPSVALILMLIGVYGLLFEFMSPGAVAPGVIGAICLLLALYALQLLPVNYAGLALIILGIGFMIAEAFLPSFGAVGLGGVIAFIAGALMLIDTDVPGFGIPVGLIASFAVASAVLMATTAGIALRTRRRAIVSGVDQLIGSDAEMLEDAVRGDGGYDGWANAGGETWRVLSRGESNLPLRRGQRVRIVGRRGAALEVIPVEAVPVDVISSHSGTRGEPP
jgi:membrane-bound serine protease (ClpP class)